MDSCLLSGKIYFRAKLSITISLFPKTVTENSIGPKSVDLRVYLSSFHSLLSLPPFCQVNYGEVADKTKVFAALPRIASKYESHIFRYVCMTKCVTDHTVVSRSTPRQPEGAVCNTRVCPAPLQDCDNSSLPLTHCHPETWKT